jgi:hypothetical protein
VEQASDKGEFYFHKISDFSEEIISGFLFYMIFEEMIHHFDGARDSSTTFLTEGALVEKRFLGRATATVSYEVSGLSGCSFELGGIHFNHNSISGYLEYKHEVTEKRGEGEHLP